MNSQEASAAMHQAWQDHKSLPFQERCKVIGPIQARIMAEWKEWLYSHELEEFSQEVLDILFQKAWEDGHASGYSEVEMFFIDLCEMQRKIQALTN